MRGGGGGEGAGGTKRIRVGGGVPAPTSAV